MQKKQKLLWEIESECEKWYFENKKTFNLKQKVNQSLFYDQNLKSKYLNGFWITENIGNNSFVYKEGEKIFVPPLKFIEANEFSTLQKGNQIVFRDKDEHGDLMEEVGLNYFFLIQSQKIGLPIYIIDNHNWAFYAWSEATHLDVFTPFEKLQTRDDKAAVKPQNTPEKPVLLPAPLLVHIDAHKDEGKASLMPFFNLQKVSSIVEQTQTLKVSNYISAAIQAGIISPEFISLTSSKDFETYAKQLKLLKQDSQNIILNVDIDIFDPEVSIISLAEKVKAIGYFANQADLITFATSPGFIEQFFAVEIVKILVKYL